VTYRPHRVLRFPATLATAILGVALVSGCGSSSASVPTNSGTNAGSSTAGGGRTHAARIDPGSILTTSEISAALGYAVAVAVKGSNPFGVTAPVDGPTFVAGGVITACTSVTVRPSPITARTAWYLCSVTLRSLMWRECQASTEVAVNRHPKACEPCTEGRSSPMCRTSTNRECPQRDSNPRPFD
jgi:hypothetical protein